MLLETLPIDTFSLKIQKLPVIIISCINIAEHYEK